MKSCLFTGTVLHARQSPAKHKFGFNTFFFFLDLDELEKTFSLTKLVSLSKWSFARFRFSDHLVHEAPCSSAAEFKQRVLQVVRKHGVKSEVSSIRLLTQLSYFGFAMNPVNFYYCYSPDDKLECVVAEVNNTPWGEQHLYVVKASPNSDVTESKAVGEAPPVAASQSGKLPSGSVSNESRQEINANNVSKDFHVSPFMPMEMTYDFDFCETKETRSIKIANFEQGKRILQVAMNLEQEPITASSLRWSLIRFPLYSWKVFIAIYWQALLLFLKRVPFVPHPDSRSFKNKSTVDATTIDQDGKVLINK